MTKRYCDCCENEIEGRVFIIPFLKHITEQNKMGGYVRIKDGQIQPFSGVEVNYDFLPNLLQ